MNDLASMLWIELRKASRSRMPLVTALGSLFMPLGIGFLIFAAKNPQISQKLGLISAKANLLAYSGTDWTTFLIFFGQLIAAGGFIFFILIISWVFGREFADGTLKDMLAVPVQRSSILLAKFVVVAVWSAALTLLIFAAGLLIGALIQVPVGSLAVILHGGGVIALTAAMTIGIVLPFALFASLGRGYLLPIGMSVLALMSANLMIIAGWGEFYPWAVPSLYAQGKTILAPASYGIVFLTGLGGMLATYVWWKFADQSR